MLELGVFFGVMGLAALWMVWVVLRRGNRRTETAEGLLIEQARREQAASDRSSYSSIAMHNSPTHGRRYRP
ncbi:hypothetical protein ACFXA3_18515 [Streptomyces sp. NPDC059456]|uniref:hypothetical protein n=1 Tax=Streptomyces sp. NPDC059456 TaxID=3346838 RepID=UPI00367BC6A2